MTPRQLGRIEDHARESVADYARKELAESQLFGREHAMSYALGVCCPIDGVSDAENVARVRGALKGLADAGMFENLAARLS